MTSTLSGSRKPSTIVHASTGSTRRGGLTFHDTACGIVGEPVLTRGEGMPVTCKRCLASLAKRDRAFRRKARRWFCTSRQRLGAEHLWPYVMQYNAARAIAREEGRAL